MRKEWWGVIALTTLAVTELAFSRPQRKRIGDLKGWKCEVEGCNRRFQDGFMIEFNHKIPLSEGGEDTDENAELRCVEDHYKFHLERGDIKAARIIKHRLDRDKGRTWSWIRKNGR